MDLRLAELVKELGALPESRFLCVMVFLFFLGSMIVVAAVLWLFMKTGVI